MKKYFKYICALFFLAGIVYGQTDTIKVRKTKPVCGCDKEVYDSIGICKLSLLIFDGETSKAFAKDFCVKISDKSGNVVFCGKGKGASILIKNLAQDSYTVIVSAEGYSPMEFKGIRTNYSQTSTMSFYLQLKKDEFKPKPPVKTVQSAGTNPDNY